MRCKVFQKQLNKMNDPINSKLDPSVNLHIQSCPTCKKEFELWEGFIANYQKITNVSAPSGLAEQIVRENRIALSNTSMLSWKLSPKLTESYALAICLILFVISAIVFIVNKMSESVKMKEIVFEASFENTGKVSIVGDFNQWDFQKNPLFKTKQGTWKAVVFLKPGCYQYQFVLDGKIWKLDPQNTVKIEDDFGGFNSGKEVL